jgi:hypothetical protein
MTVTATLITWNLAYTELACVPLGLIVVWWLRR